MNWSSQSDHLTCLVRRSRLKAPEQAAYFLVTLSVFRVFEEIQEVGSHLTKPMSVSLFHTVEDIN